MKLQILLLLAFSVFVSAGVLDTVSGVLGKTNTSIADLASNNPIIQLLPLKFLKTEFNYWKTVTKQFMELLIYYVRYYYKKSGIQIDENSLIAIMKERAPALGNELAALLE